MRQYVFKWNGKTRIIIARDMETAIERFQERFGFYPEGVEIYRLEA